MRQHQATSTKHGAFIMMKPPFWLAMVVALGLVACGDTPKQSAQSASAALATASSEDSGSLNVVYDNLVFNSAEVAPVKWDYTAASTPTTLYYDQNGQAQDNLVANGYYREILGQTADGRTVAQDFYQANGQAQTSPFLIRRDGDVGVFNKSILDSRVIWYDAQGNLTSVGQFAAGQQQGWLDVYEHNQLVLQLKDTPHGVDMRFFSPEERLWGLASLHHNLNTGSIRLTQLRFFYANGQTLSEVIVNEAGQPTGVKTYDPQGKVVAAEQNAKLNEIMLRRFAVLIRKLPQLMAR